MFQTSITLGNGTSSFVIPGAIIGNAQIVLSCQTYPSAGSVTIEYKLSGGNNWRPINDMTAVPFTDELRCTVSGAISSIRVTQSGIVGGSGCTLAALQVGNQTGISDVVQQRSFFEQSALDGQAFELSTVYQLLTLENRDTVVITGSKAIGIIGRSVQFDGASLTLRIFKTPAYTGGTIAPCFGMNNIKQNATTVQFLINPAITSTGTEIAAPKYLLGVPPSGNKTVQSQTIQGDSLRILAPNTTYLFRTTNTSADTINVATYSVWHEGDIY